MNRQFLPTREVAIENMLNVALSWYGVAFTAFVKVPQPRFLALKNSFRSAAVAIAGSLLVKTSHLFSSDPEVASSW